MTFKNDFNQALNGIPLSNHDKLIIRKRYLHIVVSAESHYYWTAFWYYTFMITITVAGALIISFSSFDLISGDTGPIKTGFSLVVWALGLIILMANKFMYVFSIAKKYVLNIIVVEKLKSEGWAFISGVGKYKKYPAMDQRFIIFCGRIEKIKQKSLEALPEMESSDPASDILATGGEYSDSPKEPMQQSSRGRSKVAFGHLASKLAARADNNAEINNIMHTLSEILAENDDNIADDDVTIMFDHDQTHEHD